MLNTAIQKYGICAPQVQLSMHFSMQAITEIGWLLQLNRGKQHLEVTGYTGYTISGKKKMQGFSKGNCRLML